MTHRNGFTLLEMLVALVVFGLLMAGISQAMRYGLLAWRQAQTATTTPETVVATDDAIRRMFIAAIPGSIVGGPDSVALTTTLPTGAGISGLSDVALVLSPAGLILRYTPHPAGPALTSRPAPTVKLLISGATALHMHYFSVSADGNEVSTTRYRGGALPDLIELSVDVPNLPNWPDLLIAPRNF